MQPFNWTVFPYFLHYCQFPLFCKPNSSPFQSAQECHKSHSNPLFHPSDQIQSCTSMAPDDRLPSFPQAAASSSRGLLELCRFMVIFTGLGVNQSTIRASLHMLAASHYPTSGWSSQALVGAIDIEWNQVRLRWCFSLKHRPLYYLSSDNLTSPTWTSAGEKSIINIPSYPRFS